jgi:hypothetical protein
MGLTVESMAIALPTVKGHPNRTGFRGVLTTVDAASDKPPAGARGHRVLLTRRAAEAAIPSLLGMGLDYAPSLDRHDARRKVGVITSAEIVRRGIEIGGFLYARDFPEVVEEIGRSTIDRTFLQTGPDGRAAVADVRKQKRPDINRLSGGRTSTEAGLGMSYEIADAQVEDIKANVWVLNRVTFTGAAILRREKAAYRETWIELAE